MGEAVTSRRSYRERQAQLNKLVNIDLPRNRIDIQEAREMGDLSENFEYESARARERMLISRQEQLAKELRETKIADFGTVVFDGHVKPGVCVTLGYPDGTKKTLCILGAWDFDEALGIVSCNGHLAEILCEEGGCRKGDRVRVPDPVFDGDELELEVLEVKKLPKKVLDWAEGS